VQLGGSLVTVPELGTVVTAFGGIASDAQDRIPSHIWIGAGVAAAFFLLATGSGGRNQRTPVESRSGGHSRDKGPRVGPCSIIILCGIIVVTTATASALAPFGPTEYRIVSADADLPGPRVIPAGESETTTYQIPGGSVFPTKYYLESASDGVRIVDGASGRIQPNAAANATVQLSAPPENGVYRRYVAEHRYPLVLPEGVVDALYAIHPLAPVVALDILLAAPFVIAARLAGGKRRPRGTPGAATGLVGLGWFRR
jgi:signal peptidase